MYVQYMYCMYVNVCSDILSYVWVGVYMCTVDVVIAGEKLNCEHNRCWEWLELQLV